jgi:enterochelin esterase-like enzyme
MPNGVPYDGSSYNNDLGPGAYPANITHGTYFSSVVNAVTGYSIYLPPEYATNPNQRFNVIYFLTGQGFGSGATENSEVTNDPELISNLQLIPPTIMVFPNPYQNSKYMDAAPGSPMSGIEMFESQFVNELIPFIDANYRTQASRDGRAIMGFSGGGQGALRLAFKYPALFSSVESISGAVDDNASNVAVNEPQLLAAMFNGDANAFDAQTANDQAKADCANIIASGVAIHMSVGSADALLPDNQVLDALLTSLGIPHDPLEVIPGGIHDLTTIFNIIGPTPFQFIDAHFLEPPPPPTVIESKGATDLDQVGNNYFLYAHGTTSGPELSFGGAPVVTGEWGAWTPIGAEQTASGYEVAWKMAGADQYQVWSTTSSGNYSSHLLGVVSGTSSALESFETTFQQDLNGDGIIGPPNIGAGETLEVISAYSSQISFAASTGTLDLLNSLSFAGTVAGMTGQDTIDFADIDPTKVQHPTYSGTASGGTLTVTDGSHTANIALLGDYMASTFVTSSDGHGGTNVVDPSATGTSQTSLLVQPHHT